MSHRRATLVVVAVLTLLSVAGIAGAADTLLEIPLTIENQQFQPAEIKVKAGAPFNLVITNKNAAAAEFESKELRVEKVIPPGKTLKVLIRALKPGTYPFIDDFHKQTAGRIVAE
jgi:plastocyanin